MNDTALLIIGGGGHAAVVIEAARAAGWRIVGALDDDPDAARGLRAVQCERLGAINAIDQALDADPNIVIHAATGNAGWRERWLHLAPQRIAPPIAHPSAAVSPTARLEAGAFVGPGAIINARSRIGRGVIINSGAIVEHDCIVGAFAHIAPGAALGGCSNVGARALVGLGARVLPHVAVGDAAILGAGAVATENIPASVTAAGVPARRVEPAKAAL